MSDGIASDGINAFTLSWVQGHLRGDTAERGSFGKLQFSLLRLQHLSRTFSLYTALQGQLTDGNLDSSERFSLGGPSAASAWRTGDHATSDKERTPRT